MNKSTFARFALSESLTRKLSEKLIGEFAIEEQGDTISFYNPNEKFFNLKISFNRKRCDIDISANYYTDCDIAMIKLELIDNLVRSIYNIHLYDRYTDINKTLIMEVKEFIEEAVEKSMASFYSKEEIVEL